MLLNSTDLLAQQSAFESFCRSELRQVFHDTQNSVSAVLTIVDEIQNSVLPIHDTSYVSSEFNSQFESVEYSFFSGGKRFRPLLAFAGAQYLNISLERTYPWALAIEMIHTYSLIHDDLPSMDNDSYRRGQLTNHKVFGESIALLSGDALLTEAFGVLSKHFADSGAVLASLVKELVHVSGLNGMIIGQYHDITLDTKLSTTSVSFLNHIHLLKTGALISGALMGPGIIKRLDDEQSKALKEVGLLLGYSFQVKDDILDAVQDKDSQKNLIHHFKDMKKLIEFLDLIQTETKNRILELNRKLNFQNTRSEHLTQFLEWNIKRDK